jgi:hypothetical protein
MYDSLELAYLKLEGSLLISPLKVVSSLILVGAIC